MEISELFTTTMDWIFSDLHRSLWIVATIGVIGAINGIRCSLNRCKGSYNGRIL